MKRRRFVGGCLLPVVGLAGCVGQTDSETTSSTSIGAGTQTDAKTTSQRIGSQAVPGWDGEALDTAALLDAHVETLSTAGSYTVDIQVTGADSADLTFQLNSSQQRIFGVLEASSRPDREAYLTASESVIQITGEETEYQTQSGLSVDQQFEVIATYQNDDFNLDFSNSVESFEYTAEGTTRFNEDTVVKLVSSSTTLDTDAKAVLLVDANGVIRSAEFTVGNTTKTYEFIALGETTVGSPDWIDNVPQATTEEPANGSEEITIQESDLVVDVEALQWYWQFTYPESGIQAMDRLVVPVGQPIVLRATSSDVPHALTIPEFDTTVDAKPNETNITRFTPSETGEVSFECTEYCGVGHSKHTGTIVVMEQDAYEDWKSNN
ncbi:hypothetical protein [Salarchaeum japonicum]|uniref:hypothetical protein n=1 Tax=Salarchaeum japonicum TaxID=555573 RepID=UPI003C72DFD4